jgi:transglutaminase-like putative cysteine protease
MRSGLTESRPAIGSNMYRPWPDPGPQRSPSLQPTVPSRRGLILAPTEGWLPLLLLSVAVYSVVYSVTAAITINHYTILWITTALGLLTGLIVSKSRFFPQAVLHIGACILGYWLALFLTSSLAYQVSVLELLSNLRTVITGGLAMAGSQSGDMVFLFYLSFLCFFLGYFGSWLIYRAHLPWLVALVYISIMIVNLNYISKRDLSFLIIILVGSLILLIARIQLASQLSQWKSDGLYTDQTWLRNMSSRFLRIAALFVLLILPFSWLLPVMNQPAAGITLWNGLDNAWANLVHGHLPALNNPGSLFSPYDPPSDFFSDQLSITGSVNLPNGPVLSYTSSDSQGHYLESFIYDSFDGHNWTAQVASTSQAYQPNAQLPLDEENASYNALTTAITVFQPPGGTKHFIFAPPVPSEFNVPITLFTDNTGTFVSSWTQTSALTQNEEYEASSEIVNASPSDLAAIPLPKNDPAIWFEDPNYNSIQEYYLQKPGDLSSEVLATARKWTDGAKNTYNAVADLQAHLSDTANFTYSLTNDPVPSNMDAVTWLLHTRKGFCTYYATAMVVMARLLGIPARMVNGFSQGHYDMQKNAWVVDGSDAHSWVQIYFPGYGWINFDPTPGFSSSNATTPGNTPVPRVTQTPAPSNPTATSKPTPRSQPTPALNQPGKNNQASTIGTFAGGNLLMGFSLIILLCSFVVLSLSIARYRTKRVPRSLATAVYTRLCRVASLVGSPPSAWQTPYEYTFTLSKRFPQASSALRRLADLFVRERWASPEQAPILAEERDLERLWPHLRNTILRSPFFKGK